MKILLLGRNGQLGWELERSLAPLGEVVALASPFCRGSQDPCGLSPQDGSIGEPRMHSRVHDPAGR